MALRPAMFSYKDSSDYTYNPSGPRKEVLLMGTKAWDNYLKSVRIRIGTLGTTAEIHRKSIGWLEGRRRAVPLLLRRRRKS